jgi:hypothetical protein
MHDDCIGIVVANVSDLNDVAWRLKEAEAPLVESIVSIRGLPSRMPRFLAAANPAFTRSTMIARSN